MATLLKTITELTVGSIDMGTRLRPVSEAGVAALAASIDQLGVMKDAIQVRRKKGKDVLLAGAHRLTAARQLGWDTIEVKLWECTDDWARLIEIDDNLAGAELTALDTAIFLAERKRIYEKMHPETVAGVAGAAARWDASDIMSFASATAEKFGLSKRHVERIVAAGSALDANDVRWLRAAPKPVTLTDLATIAKAKPDERAKVCIAMTNGTAKNAAHALKQLKTKPGDAIKRPIDKAVRAALLTMKADHGSPLGLTPNLLVVGPTQESAAKKILNNELAAGGETNEWKGTAEMLMSAYLS